MTQGGNALPVAQEAVNKNEGVCPHVESFADAGSYQLCDIGRKARKFTIFSPSLDITNNNMVLQPANGIHLRGVMVSDCQVQRPIHN